MNTLDEKTLTPNETAKKEEIVKSLKKKKADFVKRYGAERAKGVMYATATKVAKAVTEAEELSEDEAQKFMSNAMDTIAPHKRDAARTTYKKARSIGLSHAAALNTMISRHSSDKLSEESDEQLDEMGYGAARASDQMYANNGSVVPQKKTKYIVKHKASGKVLSIHDNAPGAVAARDKVGSFETHSIIKEEDCKQIQREHLQQTGELLNMSDIIKEAEGLPDGRKAGPIEAASKAHGRVKKTPAVVTAKIAAILSKTK